MAHDGALRIEAGNTCRTVLQNDVLAIVIDRNGGAPGKECPTALEGHHARLIANSRCCGTVNVEPGNASRLETTGSREIPDDTWLPLTSRMVHDAQRERLPNRSSPRFWTRGRAQAAILAAFLLLFLVPILAEILDVPDALVDSLLSHKGSTVPFVLLAAEEAGIPLPVPGDVVIAYVGYRTSIGTVPLPVAFGALLVAILIGASLLYYISSRWGRMLVDRLGRYVHVSADRLASAERRFEAHGAWFIIIGRHVPGLRIPITVFCGISGVRYSLFLASTFVSVVFWIAFWLVVGTRLGPKTVHLVHSAHWYLVFLPLGIVVAAVLVARIVVRVRGKRH